MNIDAIRIYAEVLEQGLDFKDYLIRAGYEGEILNVYTKKARSEFRENDSLIDRIRKCKDIDVLISAIHNNNEYPLLLVEYSTAVPTDDHKMQRSDVYFWGGVFGTPVMKISSATKGMNQGFGGGSRFTTEYERVIAFNHGAVFYPIPWESIDGQEVLRTKEGALSCINYTPEILEITKSLLANFYSSTNYAEYFSKLYSEYQITYGNTISSYSNEDLRAVIVDSTRFKWQGDKLCAKINRFGHAMDPDRGVLYAINMLVGASNAITEFQVNRSENYNDRGGYKALFDGVSKKRLLKQYVENIIATKSNKFDDEDALFVFFNALSIPRENLYLRNIGDHEYFIEDGVLFNFLRTHPSMSSKSIFYLTTELRLTDKNRNIICTIKWNENPISAYMQTIKSDIFSPLPIHSLSNREAKEDIVTFASVELYKKICCKLVAVSYPGAQGDRCVLTGTGRKVSRTYIDIIAYQDDNGEVAVYLEECKERFSSSIRDMEKLNTFIASDEKLQGLSLLFNKTVSIENIDKVFTSVGAKQARTIPHFDVDYIFMFSLSEDENHSYINYSVGVINTELIETFKPLAEDGRRLSGKLICDKIYIIDL